jgi:hypothetical protein
MLRIPNPVAQPCVDCGSPTVFAEFPTGLHRVHCGTYRYGCGTSSRRRTRRGLAPATRPAPSVEHAPAA